MIVDISVRNKSGVDLDWVELEWKGPKVPVGALPKEGVAISVSADWPNLSNAKLSFVDRQTRKPYDVAVSFSQVNEQVRSGKCHQITFRILSYDKADVICK